MGLTAAPFHTAPTSQRSAPKTKTKGTLKSQRDTKQRLNLGAG